jgi:hypothetical protein
MESNQTSSKSIIPTHHIKHDYRMYQNKPG